MSFNVVSLFSNMSLEKTLKIIRNKYIPLCEEHYLYSQGIVEQTNKKTIMRALLVSVITNLLI